MPDISMCANDICPLRQTCYRAMAKPNEHRQSISWFDPNDDGTCDSFMEIYDVNDNHAGRE